jgi:hypothetical protein
MAIIDYSALNRRLHYRLPVDDSSNIRVFLGSDDMEPTSAIPVNFSAGGILCQLSQEQSKSVFSRNGETQVRISFLEKGHIDLNGKIRRIESYGRRSTYDCAIQFTRVRGNHLFQGGKRLVNPKIAIEDGENITPKKNNAIECLNRTLNYGNISGTQEREKARGRVYAFYDNVVSGLSSNEQWWFYEVLDTLKSQAPNYSPALLKEYQNLYERGMTSIEYKQYNEMSRAGSRRTTHRGENIGRGGIGNL